MKPTIALVGRPNVGKSTLFNRLTRSRDAIVADMPGLTRDRHYGHGRMGNKPHLVVDTGGFEPVADAGIFLEMARQTLQAVDEADVIFFLVDARQGMTPQDKIIAERLRRSQRPVFVLVNKTEGMQRAVVTAEFFELALGEPYAISASHGDGVREVVELALQALPEPEPEPDTPDTPKIAIVGRPNVGKSTLVNAILGEERVIAFDMPGTTRDSISIDFEREGRPYTLIDTAGLRKRGKVFEAVEKFSVVKTLQSIEEANSVVIVLDAQQDISDQDTHIAGFVVESGRAVVLAVNKWDNLDSYAREQIKKDIGRKLNFLQFAEHHFISALHSQGIRGLFAAVDRAYAAAMAKLPTPKLTRTLHDAVQKQQPPSNGMVRPKLRYAHQGGSNPPLIIVHGSAVEHIPDSYRRYLERIFNETFQLQGTPLRVQFKQGHNPFADKAPPVLTKRQEDKRRRQRRWSRKTYGG